MSLPPLTPWFPAHVKPARPGVYEVGEVLQPWYRRWDGSNWRCGSPSLSYAASPKRTVYMGKRGPWRGLSREA